MRQMIAIVMLFFLSLLTYGQSIFPTMTAYTYDAAGNRVTVISTPGNDGSRSASSIVSPPSGQNVETVVTKPQKEDYSSGDDPQKIVGNIADERKNHLSPKNKQHDS